MRPGFEHRRAGVRAQPPIQRCLVTVRRTDAGPPARSPAELRSRAADVQSPDVAKVRAQVHDVAKVPCKTVYKFDMLTSSDDLQLSLEQREKYIIPGTVFSSILFLSVLGSLLVAGVLVAVQTAVEMKRILSRHGVPTCQRANGI
jgi:hypothetical protein